MKKILLLISLLLSVLTFGQNNGITYQAVIYSTGGESVPGIHNSNSPLVNKPICLQFGIVDENTQIEYQEKVTVTTDDFGMVNLVIGSGTQTGGYASSFNVIAWSNSRKNLKVSLDESGSCSNFYEISNQVLTYVPYALAANSAATVSGVVSIAHGGTNASTLIGAKTNLQLQNVDNTSDLNKPLSTATQTALDTKVDKVAGKDLSTNDFTTAEKTKLASLGGTPDLSSYATNTNLALKANSISPALTGIPTTPTASANNNSTQIANTAFVNNAITGKFVDLTTNQTIAGKKTFNSDISVNGLTIGKGTGQNDQNTAIGAGALNSSGANGTRNTAVGYLALKDYRGTSFDNNTGVGYFNMIGLTTGYGNTSIGAETMFNVGAASNNTGIGNQSLINTSGNNNVGVGARSGDGLTTGSNNTFVGTQARTTSAGNAMTNSTAIGYDATVITNNTIQLGNAAITNVNTAGTYTGSGFKTPTGTSSQYLMADGSVSNSSSSSGVPYVGASGSVDLGNNNITASNLYISAINGMRLAVGASDYNETNFMGSSAMESASGGFANTAFGHLTLAETSGNENTAFGAQAMRGNTSGSGNTAVGRASLSGNSTGSNNTAIGNSAGVSNSNLDNATAIGSGAIVNASNTIQLGNSNVNSVKTSGKLTTGTITLPNTDGTSGQVLSTDGAGSVLWSSLSVKSSDIISSSSQTSGYLNFETGVFSAQNWTELNTQWSITSGWANTRNYNGTAYQGTYAIIAPDSQDFTLEGTKDFNLASLYIKGDSMSTATSIEFKGYNAAGNLVGSVTVATSSLNSFSYSNITINFNGIRKLVFHPIGFDPNAMGGGNFFLDYFNVSILTSNSLNSVNGILKSDGNGNITAAAAGTDYLNSSSLSGYLPLTGGNLTGTVSIGTSSPQASAVLDVTSTTQGFLPPRMTQLQRNTISNPVAGLVVWCNNCGTYGELQVYNGITWTNILGGSASAVPIHVGDSYGGGTVIYLYQSGDTGYVAGEYHGIIVANDDAGYSPWGCNGTTTNAVATIIGAAAQNTSNIISSNCGGTAAQLCVDYRGGGYSNWALPSIDELNIIFTNRAYLPSSLSQYLYWSSSETSSAGAYRKDMRYTNTGSVQSFGKTSNSHVRAVRYF